MQHSCDLWILGPRLRALFLCHHQFRAAAFECCLYAAYSGSDEFCDFFERVIEYVFEEHTRTFLGRKADHEAFDSPTKDRRFDRLN